MLLRLDNTSDLSQFPAVICREYTLSKEEETSQQKNGSKEAGVDHSTSFATLLQ